MLPIDPESWEKDKYILLTTVNKMIRFIDVHIYIHKFVTATHSIVDPKME